MITGGSSGAIALPYSNANGAAVSAMPVDPNLTFFNDCGNVPRKDWIIKGVIACNETSGWVAPPGSGKSALLTDIAVHCASGTSWRGHKAVKTCGVVMMALERADLLKRRLHAYAVRDGHADLPIVVHSGMIDLVSQDSIDQIIGVVRVAEAKFGCRVGLLVIDTLNKGIAAGGGDENKAKDQNRVAANLREVQERLAVHIALVGHTGKDQDRGARGSNAFLGDVDVMVQIRDNGIKTAEVTKANDQADGVLTRFKLEPVDLGHDDDGDVVSTFIMATDYLECGLTAPKSREPKMPPNQEILLAILRKAENGLRIDEWNEKARAQGIGNKRRSDTNDGRKGLVAKGLVQERDGRWFACSG